ncbi:MAG: radical SAM protein [Aggregatilineales bacterium]|nr:radical SAM protein [Chloroflexota bacterium]HOA23289.1 radical SAM protein [Aggregatilineales bacterium]HPV05640.1 radical SAM protein [Aggregatilineales bacterium]
MVILGTWAGKPVVVNARSNSLTVSVGDPTDADVVSYDFEGRLWTAYFDGTSYRRGLDGKIVAKWRIPGRERDRRWLPRDEALAIEERARCLVENLYHAIERSEATLNMSLPPEGEVAFRRAIAFDRERSLQDAVRYHEVYKPVGILPPDQYMAVVLQLTEGCSFNTCTFCTFYKGRRFRIKPPAEFRAHAEAVRDFLGEGLSLRRSIFLGDANSLVVPMRLLVPLLDVVHEVYDVEALGGMYAFLDGFSGDKKSAEDYALLRERGMRRVYVGLESGSARLLDFLRKPGTPQDAVRAVRAMKQGGLAVGVIVLLGAGGRQFAAEHERETIRVLGEMGLDSRDILYFSELVVSEGMPYAADAAQAGLNPMTHAERLAQQEAIESALRNSHGGTPRISRYDIREFIY